MVPSGNLHLALSDEELTAEVRQLPLVVEICRRFAEHCQHLATTLESGQYACSVEICFKTWRIDKELRLHGHLFAKKSFGGRMRCTNRASLLEFEGCKPHMTNYVLSRAVKGWAAAVQAQIQGSVFNAGSFDGNADFPMKPEFRFQLVESRKMSYDNVRES